MRTIKIPRSAYSSFRLVEADGSGDRKPIKHALKCIKSLLVKNRFYFWIVFRYDIMEDVTGEVPKNKEAGYVLKFKSTFNVNIKFMQDDHLSKAFPLGILICGNPPWNYHPKWRRRTGNLSGLSLYGSRSIRNEYAPKSALLENLAERRIMEYRFWVRFEFIFPSPMISGELDS